MRLIAILLAGAAAAAIAGLLVARARFDRAAGALWQTVLATPAATARDDLPDPVRAFALRGLAGAEPARALRMRQTAQFRKAHGGPLSPLTARQVNAIARPGFVWIAQSRAGPLPVFTVVDSYVDGRGWLGAALLGAIPVGEFRGAEADRAQAMRYLAELPWCPDAILTNPSLVWLMEGADRVTVSLDTRGGAASVTFGLDEAGDFVTMTARDRPAEKGPDGKQVLRDWQGAFSDYAMVGPRRIPRRGEVGYLYDDGYEAYWIGRIDALEAHP